MMTLAEINIYPVKSARGIRVGAADVTPRGFAFDRRFMVVDEQGEFITQRQCAKLALVATRIEADTLILAAPNVPAPLAVPLVPTDGASRRVTVWGETVDAISAGDDAAQWLGQFLGRPAELVFMPETAIRPTDATFSRPGDHVSFADGFPYLLISQASLDDLNAKLAAPVPMNRFRPNLVVAGTDAFAEDAWKRVHIGGIEFRVVKACSRCVTTTIDQATAEKSVEPLRTLAMYRQRAGKTAFGQNLIPDGTGRLALGAPVEILE